MANDSIFADEWRECLQAQYQHVVRNNDQITLKSLVPVMLDVGFSEEDLRDFAFQATLRAEEVADDFVPDLEIMSGMQPAAKLDADAVPQLHSAPEVVSEIMPPEDLSGDDLGMTLEETLAVVGATLAEETEPPTLEDSAASDADNEESEAAGEPPEPESQLPPGMQQLSLF